VPEPKQSQGNKADLVARIESAVDLLGRGRADKRTSKAQLVDQVLDVLAPKA
jgi:phenylpyruvate tautomerase PptA (4-oxalocrotonate tautomerase family)